jgi:hypothetical protein
VTQNTPYPRGQWTDFWRIRATLDHADIASLDHVQLDLNLTTIEEHPTGVEVIVDRPSERNGGQEEAKIAKNPRISGRTLGQKIAPDQH